MLGCFDLRLDLSPVAGGALPRQVRQRAMARGLVLYNRSVSVASCSEVLKRKTQFLVSESQMRHLDQSLVKIARIGARIASIENGTVQESVEGLLTPVRHGC